MEPFNPETPPSLAPLVGAGDDGADGPMIVAPLPPPEQAASNGDGLAPPAADLGAPPPPQAPPEPPGPSADELWRQAEDYYARQARPAPATPWNTPDQDRILRRVDRGVGTVSSDVEQIAARLEAVERSMMITQVTMMLVVALIGLYVLRRARASSGVPGGGIVETAA